MRLPRALIAVAHVCAVVFASISVSLPLSHSSTRAGETIEKIKGIAVVVDGDNLRVAGIGVRLYGVDAPELEQTCSHPDGLTWACGKAAKEFLEQLINRHQVECIIMKQRQDDHKLCMCNANGVALGASSVAHGMAMAYRQSSDAYVGLEQQAQTARAGIWSGAFEKPWAYRSRASAGR